MKLSMVSIWCRGEDGLGQNSGMSQLWVGRDPDASKIPK